MKKIIFVENLTDSETAERIRLILNETRVLFDVSLENKAVIVHGDNDAVYAAKVALREEGYKIN